MPTFFEHLLDLLRGDDRFFADDGTFLRNAAVEAAMHLDTRLLRLLLNDKRTRENFFAEVDGITVFDKIKFAWTVNNREFLLDSYTRFANRIGLVDAHENFIADTNATALVFPYKDCVLEGGQTADDQKRTEIFYNTTLAPDEVDRLLEPKVLTNATLYTAQGAAPATDFTAADNLIVKGNNLLALKCLEKIFAAKVKCIYIDPPYNTGNDSFGYNDRFNHSTWLTFMTNRLTVAKKLLRDDGSIWISIDDDEGHYLKVLCDEIFGHDNFVATVIWEKNIRRKTTRLGCPIVTTSFWFMPRTKKFGVRIFCRAPPKWTHVIKIPTMTLAAFGLQVLYKQKAAVIITFTKLQAQMVKNFCRPLVHFGDFPKKNFLHSLLTIEFGLAKTATMFRALKDFYRKFKAA